MAEEFNKFKIRNLSRTRLKSCIFGAARRAGCNPWELKIIEIAFDNSENLEHQRKQRVDEVGDPLLEDLDI